MGPKQKPKQKNKQPIVYEEDYLEFCKSCHDIFLLLVVQVTKYGLDPKTVKTLGNGDIWNNLLMENNITNNKKLLAGIKGLQETYYDKICEAVDDIMGSLNSEVQVFIQKTLVSLEEMYNKKGDDMKPIVRATSKCVEACYSFDEMHETLSARFGQPLRTTQKMYDFYFTGKKGCKAYKQLSLVRAAQRRAEKLQSQKQQLNLDDKEQAGENQVHEQAREDRVPEQKEQQAREDQVPEQKEKAGEDQVTEQKEQAEPTKVEEPIKEEDELNTEHKEQVYSESSLLPNLKQLINYLKEILDAMTSQEKMMEALMDLQTEIATKDDLEAFERDLGRRLEAIGEDIALQVANELESLPRA
ncbi:hypothetical protein Rs2_18041 [Raphanus sativus]|nr:hypothetical protein Rs2_18041 [Raphanus sativus]